MNTKNKQVFRILIAFIFPFSTLIATPHSYAEIPNSAKVTQIVGTNSMGIRRRRGGIGPVSLGSVMQLLDKLDIPGSNGNIFALLEFYDKANQSMGLRVQAGIKNSLRTAYYFPCTASANDTFIIEWTNPKTTKQGCQKGFKISSNNRPNASLIDNSSPRVLASLNYLIGQNSPSQWRYCSVVNDAGNSWFGISEYRSNPCDSPLKQCEIEGKGNCIEITLDDWETKMTDLTALVSCNNQQEFSEKGTGETIKEQAENLWKEAQTKGATFCGLHIFSGEEAIIEPSPTAEVSRVEINPQNACLGFKVYDGEVTVRSQGDVQGNSINLGQQYQYCPNNKNPQSEKNTPFDPTTESIDMQIFEAKKNNLEFCNQQQTSGGQEGDIRSIQLTSTEGILRINYQMYAVPDQIRVLYENRELINTGLISGSNILSIPFKGNSSQVTIEVTGNQQEASTQWDYTLYCPQ